MSSVVKLEFLHDAYDLAAFRVRDHIFSALDEVPITPADCAAAIQAMRELAHRQPVRQGWHKVKAADALIAASAAANGCGVLHRDHHYERLADVIPGLVQMWIGPPTVP